MAKNQNLSQGEIGRDVVTYTAGANEQLSDAVIVAMRMAATHARTPEAVDEQHQVGLIEPLFDSIDPDALDALYSTTPAASRSTGTVTFTHSGFEVTANATGEIVVTRE